MAESNASKFAGKITSDGKIGQGGLAAGVGGTDWQSSIVTASTLTAVAGNGYWINTTSNACTITLPASASVGDTIEFSDYARNWGTNSITINQNSLNFQGYTSPNPEYNTNGQSVRIVYSGATQGWIPTVDDDVTDEVPQPPVAVDFLVIAGGGAGRLNNIGNAGGGGAGGYRNSFNSETSGGGGSSESSLTFNVGTVYTITVGAGGSIGNSGVDSSLSGADITTITSTGGGLGGGYSDIDGTAGGSGGGGGQRDSSGGSGTANQGYAGGNNSNIGGSGAGGAGAVGQNCTTPVAGNGGAGLASSITGSSVNRGGGGGGSNHGDAGSQGGIATDGGGNGRYLTTPAQDGTVNTGGGGGGMGSSVGDAGAGGSGVVILSMPDASYSGTTTGSPTIATGVSGKTVLTFNGSGSYTA